MLRVEAKKPKGVDGLKEDGSIPFPSWNIYSSRDSLPNRSSVSWSSKVAATVTKKPGPKLISHATGEEEVVVWLILSMTNVTSRGQLDTSVFLHWIYGSLFEKQTPSKASQSSMHKVVLDKGSPMKLSSSCSVEMQCVLKREATRGRINPEIVFIAELLGAKRLVDWSRKSLSAAGRWWGILQKWSWIILLIISIGENWIEGNLEEMEWWSIQWSDHLLPYYSK